MVCLRLKSAVRTMLGLIAVATISGTVFAQDPGSQLETQLKTILKVTEVDWVSNSMLKGAGTVVKLSKGDLLFRTPESQPVVCAATVRPAKQDLPNSMCRLSMKVTGDFLPAGQKLYVTKLHVNIGKDTVSLDLVDAALDATTGKPVKPTFKTGVNFVFTKGYLTSADPGQIADVINGLLPIDAADIQAPQRAASPRQPQPQAAAAMASNDVELGMTEDQVKAILGPPAKASRVAGNTTVYVYRKQITFQNGKVSAIE